MIIVHSPKGYKTGTSRNLKAANVPDLNIPGTSRDTPQNSNGNWTSTPCVYQNPGNSSWSGRVNAKNPHLHDTEMSLGRTKKRKSEEMVGFIEGPNLRLRVSLEPQPSADSNSEVVTTPHSNRELHSQNNDQVVSSSSGSSSQSGFLGWVKKRKSEAIEDDQDFELHTGLSTQKSQKSSMGLPIVIPPEVPSLADIQSSKRKATGSKKPTVYVKYHQSVQDDKPTPYGQPPVWADKRQNLCEALPYYKAYMSGAHLHDGMVRAFMVDKEVGIRDKLNDEILIARV